MAIASPALRRAQRTIGEHLRDQRKLLGLTASMVAERASISVTTLRNIEHGDNVRLDAFLNVLRVLGMLDATVEATDPLHTDLGRIRSLDSLPKRVRPRRA
jgi:transcriptional regulator with XRE-family HTH domain